MPGASTFRSRSVKHRISTERMSTSIFASDAMVLTVVSPRITPTLHVVFGSLDHRCLYGMARRRVAPNWVRMV